MRPVIAGNGLASSGLAAADEPRSEATRSRTLARANVVDRALAALAVVLCLAGALVAYGNSLDNEFALDDSHSIQSNAWVRSLAHVPRYFADASTFSTLRTNVDYRPLLQTSYAVNYALSGYDVRGWRLGNLAIHVVVSITIFFLGRRLFGSRALAPVPGLPAAAGDAAALVAAVLFAVHPVGSGVVNYISARSSSLTAALLLPAVVLYLGALAAPPARGRRVFALALFALGMLTKIEAVSLLPVLVLADVLLDPAKQSRALVARVVDRALWLRILPFLVATVVLGLLWWSRTGLDESATRAGAAMTPWTYLLTQLRAWWYYVGLLVAPLHLVADDPSYPLSRSLLEPRVLLALAGWIVVLTLALASARKVPAVTFLVLAFFLYLAPHSSVVPLAEPVNEHRPYLPLTGVFLLASVLGAGVAWRLVRAPRLLLALLVLVLAVPLVGLTRDRNLDWRDAETLWRDTVEKAPTSPRAQMNYGLSLMRRARFADAEARFREATRLAPGYALAWTNLGIVLAAQGRDDEARGAYDAAVRIMPKADPPYFWRARFRASRGDHAGAIADFEAAARNSAAPFREWVALAVLLRASGRDAEAARYEQQARAVDAAGFERESADFHATILAKGTTSQPATQTAIAIMNEGVAAMRAGRFAEAEAAFRRAQALDPKDDLIATNLGIVAAAQGRLDDARRAHDQAVALDPASDSPWYWRGRFLFAHGDLSAAAADFQAAVERNPRSLRDLAALAETLHRAGRTSEASDVTRRAEAIDPQAFQRERQAFAIEVRPKT